MEDKDARRERLKRLRQEAEPGSARAGNEEDTSQQEVMPSIKFRNYKPRDKTVADTVCLC